MLVSEPNTCRFNVMVIDSSGYKCLRMIIIISKHVIFSKYIRDCTGHVPGFKWSYK